jgi:hypothetical protein
MMYLVSKNQNLNHHHNFSPCEKGLVVIDIFNDLIDD